MYTISLISNPNSALLNDRILSSVFKVFDKENDIKWLMPKVALEFEVSKYPEHFKKVWEDLQSLQIDLAIQNSTGRKKRVLIADMDSTIIHQECIDELASEYGVGQAVSKITKKSMNGEITFEDSLRQRVSLLKGMKAQLIKKVLRKRITYASGANALVKTMKFNGCYTAIVSGGFTDFSKIIGERLGFDENIANELLLDNGTLNGFVKEPILGKSSKVLAMKNISTKLGIEYRDFLAVGDGANDIEMLKLAGLGVALHAKKVVKEAIDVKINFGDLTSLLFLQGYSANEFSV